jgi:hypothetical protein
MSTPSQFLPLLRSRLTSIAEQAAAAAEALSPDTASAIELSPRQLADLLQVLDGLAVRVGAVCDRLAGAMDPARITVG